VKEAREAIIAAKRLRELMSEKVGEIKAQISSATARCGW